MNIERIVVGEFQVNCFILWEKPHDALVIDPGDDSFNIGVFLKKNGLTPVFYLFTHGHCDHISALPDLCRDFPAPVSMHRSDLEWAFREDNDFPPFYESIRQPPVEIRELSGDVCYSDAGLEYRILHTPGHTPGSVCLYFHHDGVLFTGDTLFAGSVGRTDLPGGNPHNLQRSVDFLSSLPDTTRVYPGHGPDSTILHEKKTNYFMRSPNRIGLDT